ncbi:MAG TPA: [Fe-Fe] hydrogenase large subunit C-terminal domain-containing protein [Atribacteraceae bacterium]|nr:[Fe-Fe] hydrogenase large subunit C-terminal domain-containing protein [Atribacteraceae bacterium]
MKEKLCHSVLLDEEKCKGCTHCIRRCPTEAIRVKGGKARIDEERCIDCGECIRTCPNHAKYAQSDPLEAIGHYRYSIALPAPAFYAQFSTGFTLGKLLYGLLELGFSDVYEVARGAEILAEEIKKILRSGHLPPPLISSACPAVVRLAEEKFPSLTGNLLPLDSPLGVAARIARSRALEKGFSPEEIGVFFITPCPAKVTEIRQSVGDLERIDGAISMAKIYPLIINMTEKLQDISGIQRASWKGIGWARSGGEQESLDEGEYVAVDGIHDVMSVFEKIEMGELNNLVYCEAQACVGGCIGGVLAVQNPFLAKVNVNRLIRKYSVFQAIEEKEWDKLARQDAFRRKKPFIARDILKLDQDYKRALEKYQIIEKILDRLPGLDCGACGSPTCRSLAEDVVREKAQEIDCPFLLREKMLELSREIFDLANKIPQTMKNDERGKKTIEGS